MYVRKTKLWRLFSLICLSLGCVVPMAVADPVHLSQFKWENRLLVGCDLRERGPREVGLLGDLSAILHEDQDMSRKLAMVLILPESWRVWGQTQSRDPKIVAAFEAMGKKINDKSVGLSAIDRICPDCGYEFKEKQRDAIARRLNCRAGEQVTALIGLDGGIKATWRNEVPSHGEVFALIDAMPMRAEELRNQDVE